MQTERANAKINLYLDVTNRRDSGYHDIVSIMQTVSLCDLVSVRFLPSDHTSIHLRASGNAQMPTDCRNLAWRAAEAYLQRIDRSGEVELFIEKHIPMAAGLAGGSADAAAVLRAMNALCGSPLSVDALCALGATLGADIPFCIRGGSALITGIGDVIRKIPPMPMGHLVLACRGSGVSTPWAYGELDRRYHSFVGRVSNDARPEEILSCWREGELFASCKHFYNLFEEVVPDVQQDVMQLKRMMEADGAWRAMMSGSGPSVFGVFPSIQAAEQACAHLKAEGAQAFVCHPK